MQRARRTANLLFVCALLFPGIATSAESPKSAASRVTVPQAAGKPSSSKAPATAATSSPVAAKPAISFIKATALSRWVLIALEQAKQTNDYAVLRALGSSQFQAANSTEALSATFAAQRQYNTSMLLVQDPRFTQVPYMGPQGQLRMVGYYEVSGLRERFELGFVAEKEEWRLVHLAVAIDAPKPAAVAKPAVPPISAKPKK